MSSNDSKLDGAESPITVIANENMFCHFFTIESFENLFGPASQALKKQKKSEKHTESTKTIDPIDEALAREIKFDSTKFRMKCILGKGSFGVVLMAEYRIDKESKPTVYALKCLSKVGVIETGQLRHVLDERKLLSMMNSQFILKLFGVYQTPHQLVMVTEALEHGDLWGVIYETTPYCDNEYLEKSLAIFYIASLMLALDHIHRAGVVFRDLKPENIMIDSKGYVRVIDFGFAKRVPYTKIDTNGDEKVYAKTYTLCGTPGLLFMNIFYHIIIDCYLFIDYRILITRINI